jgi:hypothetical protein
MKTLIKIHDKQHFIAALRFAKSQSKNTRKSFRYCLSTLNRLKKNGRFGDSTLNISKDFVTHSFYWWIGYPNESPMYNGGMILHGFEETLSIEINPASYPHWSIHT